jgi:hypothetical protein
MQRNSVRDIMLEFAKMTGLSPESSLPKRYLWTDAYAACNFLGIYHRTGDKKFRRLALLLVDQVHATLGRHRSDDPRTGWISGLSEEEGRRHPTKGGLRIGKEMNERRPDEPFDERLEWDRDGQYYHYLTQWMHALDCVSRVTGEPDFNRLAIELAKTAHEKFTYVPPQGGEKRLYWKMSIDLSYKLVSSMGHHDPLDGLITYSELQASRAKYLARSALPDLSAEIRDMALRICPLVQNYFTLCWQVNVKADILSISVESYGRQQVCVKQDFRKDSAGHTSSRKYQYKVARR